MSLTIEVLKAAYKNLQADVDATSDTLNSFPRMSNGLTSDTDKTPEWKAAKKAYATAFSTLREFNGKYAKVLNKHRKTRAEKIAAKATI